MQTLNDPKRKVKRDAARARAAEQQALDAALGAWQSAQHELIEERYRLTFSETVPTASVREMVAALALLRYAPSTTPISQIGAWLDLLHPAQAETVQLLGALVRGRLIRIHPTTPVIVIEWKSSFLDALAAAGGDLESVELNPRPHRTSSRWTAASTHRSPRARGPAPSTWTPH